MRLNTLVLAASLSVSSVCGQVIPNRFIVEVAGEPVGRLFRSKAAPANLEGARAALQSAQQTVARGIRARGGRVLAGMDTTLNALIVEGGSAADFARLPGVVRVVPDRMSWARLDRVLTLSRVPEAWQQIGGVAAAGAGRRVAILDTGIDTTHPGFRDESLTIPDGYPKTSSEANAKLVTNKVIVVRSYEDLAANEGYGVDGSDANGHGTNAACAAACVVHETRIGVIAGAAPKAYLGAYKVLGNNGGGPNSVILKGIDDAVKDGFEVLNLSLGSDVAGNPADDLQVKAVNKAVEAGVIVVVAAGNAGPDENTINSPGTAEKVITVGSSSSDRTFTEEGAKKIDPNRLSSFSSRGPNPGKGLKPDLVAVGDNFYTATTRLPNPDVFYTITQGTSFATPTVAGAAATLLSARPGLSEAQYRSLLINSASEIRLNGETPAPIRHQGAGRLDLLAAINAPVAFAPTSIRWGVGETTIDATREIVVTNLTDAAVTLELSVRPAGDKAGPEIDRPAKIEVAAKGSETVRLKFAATSLEGEHQVVLIAKNSVNEVVSRIPYWYAVQTSVAKTITLLEFKDSAKAGETALLYVRVVDAAGIEIVGAPIEVIAESAGMQVVGTEAHPEVAGVTLIGVKLAVGENVFRVSSGEATRRIVMTGN